MGTSILEVSILAGICMYPWLKQCLRCIRRSLSTVQTPTTRNIAWSYKCLFLYQVSKPSTNLIYIRCGGRLSSSPGLTRPLLAFFFICPFSASCSIHTGPLPTVHTLCFLQSPPHCLWRSNVGDTFSCPSGLFLLRSCITSCPPRVVGLHVVVRIVLC
jgi:hypothetical protein